VPKRTDGNINTGSLTIKNSRGIHKVEYLKMLGALHNYICCLCSCIKHMYIANIIAHKNALGQDKVAHQ
jgi:hypothetical protein